MRELKIKVDFSYGKILPQIEYGPYDSSDIVSKAIISVFDYKTLQVMYEEKRFEVQFMSEDKAILIYKYM